MKSPKNVLELGQAIVKELELDSRGSVLERWLSHYLAELISKADTAVGDKKETAQQQATDVILKLWMHRRGLPDPIDPLSGYRNAIEVLGRLVPEADPWRRYQHNEPYEGLLHEMFETLSRIVLGGVILTQISHTRPISEAESKALEEEELFCHAELEKWVKFFNLPPQRPKVEIKIVDSVDVEIDKTQDEPSEVDQDGVSPEQKPELDEEYIHSAIVDNLELMQEKLNTLLTRWKEVANKPK